MKLNLYESYLTETTDGVRNYLFHGLHNHPKTKDRKMERAHGTLRNEAFS